MTFSWLPWHFLVDTMTIHLVPMTLTSYLPCHLTIRDETVTLSCCRRKLRYEWSVIALTITYVGTWVTRSLMVPGIINQTFFHLCSFSVDTYGTICLRLYLFFPRVFYFFVALWECVCTSATVNLSCLSVCVSRTLSLSVLLSLVCFLLFPLRFLWIVF